MAIEAQIQNTVAKILPATEGLLVATTVNYLPNYPLHII